VHSSDFKEEKKRLEKIAKDTGVEKELRELIS
jgi:hypothetical protein